MELESYYNRKLKKGDTVIYSLFKGIDPTTLDISCVHHKIGIIKHIGTEKQQVYILPVQNNPNAEWVSRPISEIMLAPPEALLLNLTV